MSENIVRTEYSELMQKSYIDYSMSVITARALPDVRDGLKPVQRRVLYAMDQLGLNYDKPHRKSARIVGDAMGKYHPHGDSSIYETLVVLSQDFKKGMALVDGHGNFGSIEGDSAAAMRYTEARLKKFTQEVYLKDLNLDTVDFVPNFDNSEKEPEVLPVRVPNLLVNGADGIAVGMTTNIAPHNLGEIVDAVCAYIDKPSISVEELLSIAPGPDFPTGGIVINKDELTNIYKTGNGKIKVRGKIEFEPAKKKGEKDRLVITEIPYTMIGAGIGKFISDIIDLVDSRKTTDITDVSNESSKEGIRIVIEVKKNADIENLKNLLYSKTKLEDTFGMNMLAIVNGKPETLSLYDIIKHHVDFHVELTSRKYKTLLASKLSEKEIKEGLIRACDCIDLIIEILRGSKNLKMAKDCLINGNCEGIKFKSQESRLEASKLNFTEKQATAILEMILYKLIGLEIDALKKEYEDCLQKIAEYKDILENKSSMMKLIKKDLRDIKKEFAVERRTLIENSSKAVFVEKEIGEQEVVFIMDRFGYAKTIDTAAYERNQTAILNDFKYVFTCMNTDKIVIFTDNGLMHQIKLMSIPFTNKFRDKGVPIDNLGNYDSSGERIIFLSTAKKLEGKKLLFVTKLGMLKIVDTKEFDASKKTIAATKLLENDLIAEIYETDVKVESFSKFNLDGSISEENLIVSDKLLILQTQDGFFLKFRLDSIPEKKKNAVGVRGIKLGKDDSISDVYMINESDELSIEYAGKSVNLTSMKTSHRDAKGTKIKTK